MLDVTVARFIAPTASVQIKKQAWLFLVCLILFTTIKQFKIICRQGVCDNVSDNFINAGSCWRCMGGLLPNPPFLCGRFPCAKLHSANANVNDKITSFFMWIIVLVCFSEIKTPTGCECLINSKNYFEVRNLGRVSFRWENQEPNVHLSVITSQ